MTTYSIKKQAIKQNTQNKNLPFTDIYLKSKLNYKPLGILYMEFRANSDNLNLCCILCSFVVIAFYFYNN